MASKWVQLSVLLLVFCFVISLPATSIAVNGSCKYVGACETQAECMSMCMANGLKNILKTIFCGPASTGYDAPSIPKQCCCVV
ncbi:hypothetical protein Dimus_025471 [Dionaea muscipula]